MQSSDLYAPKTVMALLGVSSSALRNYTRDYERWFSTEATNKPRQFTPDDIRLIAYIVNCTKSRGMQHIEVEESLRSGDGFDDFEWQLPESADTGPTAQDDDYGHLVPVERVQAVTLLMNDAKQREEATAEELKTARQTIEELRQQLGNAEGKLATHYRAPEWWRKLFGGAGE